MVVNHVRKMIHRISIRLHKHKVFFRVFLLERPVDGVLEAWGSKATRVESHNMRLASGSSLIGFSTRDGATSARVSGRLAGVMGSTLLAFEILLFTKAAVCRAVI
jgi:hypothetical protein